MGIPRIVAVSGGKDSTAMALRLVEVEPCDDYQFCITPTQRELPDMQAHWSNLACLLGRPLTIPPGPTLIELIRKYRALPNWRMRWCTGQVKIEPFMAYAASLAPCVSCVGIRADEAADREGTDWSAIEGVTQDFPLVRWGWTISHVKGYLAERGIEVPERTDCDFCFFQRLSEWWRLWRNHPDKYQEAEALEAWTEHTFRSDSRDTWPTDLKSLRLKFEAGFIPKGADQLKFKLDVAERATMCAWCAR